MRSDLNEEQVCVIRSMNKVWNLSNAEIGRRMNLPRTTVRDIVNRNSWRYTPPSDPETVERLVRELKEWHGCQAELTSPGAPTVMHLLGPIVLRST